MNKKWQATLIMSTFVIIGFIVLFPNNLIDQKLTMTLKENTGFYNFFYYITFFGSRIILIPFVILGSIFLYGKLKIIQPSLVFMSGTLLSYFSNELIKAIINRDRPSIFEEVHAVGYSFPSGHAMISTVCYGLFTYYLLRMIKMKRTKKILVSSTVILLLMIGYSRIGLNVHYFTDVLGGYLIGMVFIVVYLKIIKLVFK